MEAPTLARTAKAATSRGKQCVMCNAQPAPEESLEHAAWDMSAERSTPAIKMSPLETCDSRRARGGSAMRSSKCLKARLERSRKIASAWRMSGQDAHAKDLGYLEVKEPSPTLEVIRRAQAPSRRRQRPRSQKPHRCAQMRVNAAGGQGRAHRRERGPDGRAASTGASGEGASGDGAWSRTRPMWVTTLRTVHRFHLHPIRMPQKMGKTWSPPAMASHEPSTHCGGRRRWGRPRGSRSRSPR